jgi:hypothetical protein
MSQQDNFLSGFLLGTAVGGVVGGIVGVLVTSRFAQNPSEGDESASLEGKPDDARSLNITNDRSIEAARRGLEDKIAQLNEAIDDVRQRLGGVNGSPPADEGEQTLSQDS